MSYLFKTLINIGVNIMMRELINQDIEKTKAKGAVARKLFQALSTLICFIWIAGIVWILLRYSKNHDTQLFIPLLFLTAAVIIVMFIVLKIQHAAAYAPTQQVFLDGNELCVYYVEDAGSDKDEQKRFRPCFCIIPYDAAAVSFSGRIVFRGNIRQVLLSLGTGISSITLDDAKRIAKESRLEYFKTSRLCRKVVLNRTYNAQQEREMMDAFHHPQIGQEQEAGSSWRILLDQYIREKLENLEIADTATQSTWYADYLAKRRQKKLGVDVKETYESRGKLHETYVGSWNDGRNTRTIVCTNGYRRRIYSLAGKKLEIKKKYTCTFSILTSKIQKDRYTCQNCGSESKAEDLMNGCPFCGTKFDLASYDTKLSGVQYDPLRTSSALIVIGPLLLICLAVFTYAFLNGNHQDLLAFVTDNIFKAGILSLYAVPILLIIWGVFTVIKRTKGNRINDLGRMIRKTDPNFSCEEFEGIINARLKGFFLADAADNIRCFTNLQPGSFNSLADVEVLAYRRPRRLVVDNAFRVDVLLEMISVENERLLRREGTYTIDLYREPALQTKLLSDREIYTCPSCAGSISILNGGICAHCGNVMDMAHYGWVLGKVEKIR